MLLSIGGPHVRKVEGDTLVQDMALRFLNSEKHMMTVVRIGSAKYPDQRQWRRRVIAWAKSASVGVSLAAKFGLDTLLRRLVDECGQNIFAKNVFGNTALHEASTRGFESTARLLINKWKFNVTHLSRSRSPAQASDLEEADNPHRYGHECVGAE